MGNDVPKAGRILSVKSRFNGKEKQAPQNGRVFLQGCLLLQAFSPRLLNGFGYNSICCFLTDSEAYSPFHVTTDT